MKIKAKVTTYSPNIIFLIKYKYILEALAVSILVRHPKF